MDGTPTEEIRSPARRRLLKFGLAGAVVLVTVPFIVSREAKPRAAGFAHLREPDLELWRAIIPAMLAGVLPADAAAREPLVAEIVQRIDTGLELLRPSLRKATFEMLDFVELAPPRGLSGGFWGAWREASVADATTVLESWSTSRLQLLRACYRSLHDFIMGSWYGMPQSWAAVGYPGPPQLGRSAA